MNTRVLVPFIHSAFDGVMVHRLPANLKSEDHGAVLNWLIERKCRRQPNELTDLLHSGLVE